VKRGTRGGIRITHGLKPRKAPQRVFGIPVAFIPLALGNSAIAYLVATNMEQCIIKELSRGGDSHMCKRPSNCSSKAVEHMQQV
jgi:hypothetical protein